MALNTKIQLMLEAIQTNPLDLGTPTDKLNYVKTIELADGVGLAQADQIFHDQRTLGVSAAEDLDLAGGLTDAFGNLLTFSAIKGMIFQAAIGNTNNVVIGGKLTNAFINWVSDATDELILKPGGFFALIDPTAGGYAVTAGTGDILEVTNSGGGTSVTYDVIIIGIS